MAFGDNLKETKDPSQNPDDKTASEILESILNNPNPSIETNQQAIHEERIKNAPKIVQDYYAGKVNQFDKGLFKVLVAKKSNRIIFFIMLFCLLIVFINGTVGNRSNIAVINGYECELHGFVYDGICHASIKIHPIKKTKKILEKAVENPDFDTVYPVTASFSGITESDAIIEFDSQCKEQILLDEKILRTSIDDCDIIYIICKVKIGDKEGELKTKVSHKVQ